MLLNLVASFAHENVSFSFKDCPHQHARWHTRKGNYFCPREGVNTTLEVVIKCVVLKQNSFETNRGTLWGRWTVELHKGINQITINNVLLSDIKAYCICYFTAFQMK